MDGKEGIGTAVEIMVKLVVLVRLALHQGWERVPKPPKPRQRQ